MCEWTQPSSLLGLQIVGTIGPVSENAHTTQELTNAGLKIMRVNFSHATYDEAILRLKNLRASKGVHATHGEEFNVRAALLDTQGPEIRGGSFGPHKKVQLTRGNKITLTTDARYRDTSTDKLLYVTYTKLPSTVSIGDTILCDDGLISLTVEDVDIANGHVHCRIENTEELGNRKGINLPGLVVDLPAMTDKDRQDIEFGIKHDMDFIAVSFVRKPEDIETVKAFVAKTMAKYWPPNHPEPKIISKIENYEGVCNFDRILNVSDGIMVARGDLGVEIPMHQVLSCQKDMVHKCNIAGKPVIVATQMLESMIKNPRPTRAEIMDVGNAVLDGADAVMLSGEVAYGKYPVASVQTMMSVIKEADALVQSRAFVAPKVVGEREAVAASVVQTARDLHAALIVVLTPKGELAQLVSKFRPNVPVLCYTQSLKIGRQLQMYRGLYPIVTTKEHLALEDAIEVAKKMGWLHPQDKVVMFSYDPKSCLRMDKQYVMRIATVT